MPKEPRINSESDVKKQVKKLLDKHGFFWWMPPANGFGKIGVSDFNALRDGVFLAIETKFGKNKPTLHQKAYIESINASGGMAFIVNEATLDWLRQWLEAFDRSAEQIAKREKIADADGALMLDAAAQMTDLS